MSTVFRDFNYEIPYKTDILRYTVKLDGGLKADGDKNERVNDFRSVERGSTEALVDEVDCVGATPLARPPLILICL